MRRDSILGRIPHDKQATSVLSEEIVLPYALLSNKEIRLLRK